MRGIGYAVFFCYYPHRAMHSDILSVITLFSGKAGEIKQVVFLDECQPGIFIAEQNQMIARLDVEDFPCPRRKNNLSLFADLHQTEYMLALRRRLQPEP